MLGRLRPSTRITTRWLRTLGAALCLMLVNGSGHAHLLNMTKVIVTIGADRKLDVDMEVDMSRAVGGSLEYYRISQVQDPMQDPAFAQSLTTLVQAIALQAGAEQATLQLVSAELPKLSKEDFLNPISWPMTRLRLTGKLPASNDSQARLQGMFKPTFRFEEPIALTFLVTEEQRSMTRWLIAGQQSPLFDLRQSTQPVSDNNSLWQYLVFGFTHIVPKGIDHVLFVIGLYFGARNFKSLLILVTCFTLAHSITLGMASLNIIRLPAAVVEPLIAASIVWIGIENLFSHQKLSYRPLLVFGFGLLHGLGFASVLAELDLQQGNFLLALLSFNVGIELGQLCVIAAAVLATLWFRQRSWYRTRITLPVSLAIAATAGIWSIQRIWS